MPTIRIVWSKDGDTVEELAVVISDYGPTFLGVLGTLGLGSIIGAFLTAKSEDRRERRTWQRDRQVNAYENFIKVLTDSLLRVRERPAEGLSEAESGRLADQLNNGNQEDTDRIMQAVLQVSSFGDRKFADHANQLGAAWEQWLFEATPVSGVQTRIPAEQRRQAIRHMQEELVILTFRMRRSLGELGRLNRLQIWLRPTPRYRRDHRIALEQQLKYTISKRTKTKGAKRNTGKQQPQGDRLKLEEAHARSTLIEWRVRDCRSEIPTQASGYHTLERPWTVLKVDHPNYFQPIAAVALKQPGQAWKLAIEGRLPAETIRELELDAVRLVTGNTGAWPRKYGAHSWIPGETTDDRIYLWHIEELQTLGLSTGSDDPSEVDQPKVDTGAVATGEPDFGHSWS